MLDDDRWKAITTVRYLAHPKSLKHQPRRSYAVNVTTPSRVFGVDRKTIRKMLSFSVPPGFRRSAPPRRPKLDPFTRIIDRILEDDRSSHHKQRHTAKRIFDRLRDEYGFTGGYTIQTVWKLGRGRGWRFR